MADQTEIPDDAVDDWMSLTDVVHLAAANETMIPDAAVAAAAAVLREWTGGTWGDAPELRLALAAAAPLLIAAELDRLVDDRANYNVAGGFRPTVLVTRGKELRAAALRGEA
jgi:hypothetical protein